jgi:molybdopterin synthase sulfur carrier subunit
LVCLVDLVCFVYLVDLVHLVCFVQPNKRDKPNKPNNEEAMVTVLVFGLTLRDAVGETEFEFEVSEPTTVRKLIESNQHRMGPLVQFLANREVMIAVNKKVSAEDTVVKDGDIVKLSHQSRMSYDGTRDIPI